jgi:nitrogen regulatory protein PII
MKEIKEIIQPFMLQRVIDALHQIKDLPAVTISTAHGLSVERGAFDQVLKTKLEIIVPDGQVEQLVQTIQKAAHTGNSGDGHSTC